MSKSLFTFILGFLLAVVPALCQQDALLRVTQKVVPNVVVINATFHDIDQKDGFGFISGEGDGKLYLVTAGHVVHNKGGILADEIIIKVSNRLEKYYAKEVTWFEEYDLSLLVLDAIPSFVWEKKCLGKNPKQYDKVRFIGRIGRNKSLLPSPEGQVDIVEDNTIDITIATVRHGVSGAPLIGKSGIVGMMLEDDGGNDQARALNVGRIRALIGMPNSPYLSALAYDEQETPYLPDNVEPDITGYNLVRVKGGTFKMGCTSEQGSDCHGDENPVHQVSLSDFYIGKYEVTQKEWQDVMGSNPSFFKDCGECPVEQVSWDDVQEFLRRLNAETGQNFRLPTEAEWEYAARGGNLSRRHKFAGSDDLNQVAWYRSNAGDRTHPVGQRSPNELDLYDMSGNVWEWCQDRHGAYSPTVQYNPEGPGFGTIRVIRGGAWGKDRDYLRITYRNIAWLPPDHRNADVGFRLVRTP